MAKNYANTGLGGSRISKDKDKGLYFDPPLMMPGSGVTFEYVDVINKTELEAGGNWDANLMPWATNHTKGLKIHASFGQSDDYTGEVTISGSIADVTLTVADGLITDISTAAKDAYSGEVTVSGAVFTISGGLVTNVA